MQRLMVKQPIHTPQYGWRILRRGSRKRFGFGGSSGIGGWRKKVSFWKKFSFCIVRKSLDKAEEEEKALWKERAAKEIAEWYERQEDQFQKNKVVNRLVW